MELELKEYLMIIKKRLWIIASIVLISCVATGVLSYYFIQPVYAANAKLIVSKTSENQGLQSLDYNSVNTNIMLINTYKEIIGTPAIMDKVVERYPEINLTSEKLSKIIKVSSTNQTQVMTITVEDHTYNQAVKIVNAVAEVFKNQIPSIMKVDNITILNEAKEQVNPKPVKPNPLINIVISLLVSFMISVGITFLLEYWDDSIKTERDVESYLGFPTIGVISKMKAKEIKVKSASQQKLVGEGAYVSANQ